MLKIKRLPDWRSHLVAYLNDAARRPMIPGVHDCALFAAGGVQAVCGVDPVADWRGGYDSIPDGIRALRAQGVRDHVAFAGMMFPAVPVAMAQVGDIAAVSTDDGMALGIVQGEMIYVLQPDGLGLVPLLTASTAFAVGRF